MHKYCVSHLNAHRCKKMVAENEAAPRLQRNTCGNEGLATSQPFPLTLLEASRYDNAHIFS